LAAALASAAVEVWEVVAGGCTGVYLNPRNGDTGAFLA
jgi:hypothetical protein